jgi:hypothetical protein
MQQHQRRQDANIDALAKRSSTNSTIATTTRTVNSAQFTSNLANAWNPGRRSIWFQRKAVIITSIFLAIFIVLIIGCVVFLRGKRDEDPDEEYDVSDEAALARMREERDMRLGSRSEKRSKRRKRASGNNHEDDTSSTRRDTPGSTTAILASRWGRISARKIRLRKSRSKDSSVDEKAQAEAVPMAIDEARPIDQSATSLSPTEEQGLPSLASTERSASGERSPRHANGSLGEVPQSHTSASQASSSLAGAARLNAADLAAAEEEEERLRNSEALPPAYISGHQRRTTTGAEMLHITAERQLAGQESGYAETRRDEKQAEGSSGWQAAREGSASMLSEPSSLHGPATVVSSTGSETLRPAGDLQVLAGHLATDDKSLLSQMRAAASRPDEYAPVYAASAPMDAGGADASSIHTAPSAPLPQDDDGHLHPQEAGSSTIMSTPLASEKGKAVSRDAPYASRLPAPPVQQTQVAFSSFDLPYDNIPSIASVAPVTSASSTSNQGKEKEAEAADEALAYMASQPGNMVSLPRYEHAEASIIPSAPMLDDEDTHVSEVQPSDPSQFAPSAPPAP